MSETIVKDTAEVLALVKRAQEGDSRAENRLCYMYSPYVEYVVSIYSKKTNIKDDDDLRAYINIGLLEGIRRFKPDKNTRFIFFAHIWMKKHIFLGSHEQRFIRLPANQHTKHQQQKKQIKLLGEDVYLNNLDCSSMSKFMAIENTAISHFSELTYKSDRSIEEQLFLMAAKKASDDHKEVEKTLSTEILKKNIASVLSAFNEKEVYIIEASFGLNGVDRISSEQIAANLGVTKVNITFTKTRVIRMLRHKSFSDKLLEGL